MNTEQSLPWYRVPTAWLVFGLPLVAVVVGFIMMGFAIASYDGLVVDDYYRHGKEINLDLARDRLAATQGRSASLQLTERELVVDLRSKVAGKPERIDVQLLHATRQGNDQHLSLPRASDGRYRTPLRGLRPGRYNVELAADGWRLLGSLSVPGDTHLNLTAATD
jgi:hypothetical protein